MERIKELVDILVEIEGMGFSPNSEEEERYKEGVKLLLEEVQKLNGKLNGNVNGKVNGNG
jgi:hypothetical protein